jgi:hypothetical protein
MCATEWCTKVPNIVNDPKCARCMKAKGGRICKGPKGKKCTGCRVFQDEKTLFALCVFRFA